MYEIGQRIYINGSNNKNVTWYVASAQIYDATSKTIKADFQNKYNFTTATNQTLTAQWTPNTYYIAYNTNWWAWTAMSNTTCTYDSNCALSSNTYTRAWYTFKWWSTSSSATTATYTDGQHRDWHEHVQIQHEWQHTIYEQVVILVVIQQSQVQQVIRHEWM